MAARRKEIAQKSALISIDDGYLSCNMAQSIRPILKKLGYADNLSFQIEGSVMGVGDGTGVALATSGTAGTGVRALQAAKTKESERRAMNKRMSFR